MKSTMKVGYIGLGAMGAPMAGHLASKGLLHMVWNRSGEKSQAFAEQHQVIAAATPMQLAAACDVIVINVSADQDVLAVVHMCEQSIRAGTVVIDNSTVSPFTARALAASLKPLGVDFIDAPVSGGVEGAKNGKLSVMCGGDATVLARVQPVLEAFSARITHMGDVGQGQATKAVNQIVVAGIAQGVCEALAMAEKLDLPRDKLLSVLTGGAANSWFLERRGATMLNNEFVTGFKLGLLLKDLKIVEQIGNSLGLHQSVVRQSIADYEALVNEGRSEEEISALIRKKRA
jgi:3-hydroxyisobutyrate dehydrogenase